MSADHFFDKNIKLDSYFFILESKVLLDVSCLAPKNKNFTNIPTIDNFSIYIDKLLLNSRLIGYFISILRGTYYGGMYPLHFVTRNSHTTQ